MKYNLYKKRKRLPFHLARWSNCPGLPMTIWLSFEHGKGKIGPWIQVSSVSCLVSDNANERYDIAIVSVSDNPKILFGELSTEFYLKIRNFILRYKEDYIKMWNQEISQFKFIDIVKGNSNESK